MQFLKTILIGSEFKQIKKISYPVCVNCKHFQLNNEHSDHKNKVKYAKCTYFGEKDVISGEIEHEYASVCRISVYKCGEYGKYYEPKE
jgi:hypothetical protein